MPDVKIKRREFVKKAAYAAPLILTLKAMPAFAATVPGPTGHVIASAADVTDTLVICDIGPALPTSPCTYGVNNTGTGVVTSTVNSQPTGAIIQDLTSTGGNVTGTISPNASGATWST